MKNEKEFSELVDELIDSFIKMPKEEQLEFMEIFFNKLHKKDLIRYMSDLLRKEFKIKCDIEAKK